MLHHIIRYNKITSHFVTFMSYYQVNTNQVICVFSWIPWKHRISHWGAPSAASSSSMAPMAPGPGDVPGPPYGNRGNGYWMGQWRCKTCGSRHESVGFFYGCFWDGKSVHVHPCAFPFFGIYWSIMRKLQLVMWNGYRSVILDIFEEVVSNHSRSIWKVPRTQLQ